MGCTFALLRFIFDIKAILTVFVYFIDDLLEVAGGSQNVAFLLYTF